MLLAAIALSSCDLGTPLPALAQMGYWPTASGGGGGGSPGGASGQIQVNNAGLFGGLALGDLANVANTINVTGLNGQSLEAYHASPPPIGSTAPNSGAFTSLTVTGITGSTQCVHVNSAGLLSGTGTDCGAGGGGVPYSAQARSVTTSTYVTNSTTPLMAGFGAIVTITPTKSSRVMVVAACTAMNTTSAGNDTVALYYGAGTAPTAGTAVTGSLVGQSLTFRPGQAGSNEPFTITAVVSGLTVGTTYWFDLSAADFGTAYALTVGNCNVSLVEV